MTKTTKLTTKKQTARQTSAVAVQKAVTDKNTLSVRRPSEFLAMEFNPADLYLENGIFAKGQPTTILGPGGVGKSRLVLQLAASTIIGREFLGMKVGARKLRWLVLQAENSNRRLKADMGKLQGWLNKTDWKTVDANLHIHTLEEDHDISLGLDDAASKARVAQLIKDTQADVVVFDPLSAFGSGNLNSDSAMRKTCQTLTEVARLGNPNCAIVILHHTLTGKEGARKAVGYDRASYGRGSKSLMFWTRGQINVAPASADNNGRLVIACGKNSNGPDFETFGIKLNPVTMIYEVDPEFDLEAWKADLEGDAPVAIKPTPEAIAALVDALPMKGPDLCEQVQEKFGCGKSTAYAAIQKAEGKTIRKIKGKYQKM